MTPSKILFCLCLSFIVGIFLSSAVDFSPIFLWGVLFLVVFLIFILFFLFPAKQFFIIGFSVLFLLLGIFRGLAAEFKAENNELRKLNDSGQEIILQGVILKEPDIREKNIKLTIKIENGTKVLITANRYPEYQYGDKLKVKGKLESPIEDLEGFNYKDYLKKEGIYSIISWPEIELLERGRGNLFYSQILFFKNKLRESIYSSLSPPQSSILGAMILGEKRRISEDLKDKLNVTGLRHITAVSGMHVVILTGILMASLIGLGVGKSKAFYLTTLTIFIFVVMTGFQSSGIRAGIMGGLFLLGQKIGRLSFSSRSIVTAAALMLAVNPFLLRLDVGFQLSFLAVLGIIYLMPVFNYWFNLLSNKIMSWFTFAPNKVETGMIDRIFNLLAMTISAQIFTLPILIYNFGIVSQVAILTNILVIPFLPFVMIFGFLSGLVGILWQNLGQVLAWPSWLLLTYLITLAGLFSKLPLAYLTFENVHWLWLPFSYLILAVITWRLNKRTEFVI